MQLLNLPCSSSTITTTKLSVSLFGVVVLLLPFVSLTTCCTEQEESSLIGFLDGLLPGRNGSLSMSWVKGTDCCRWEGINCSSDGTVTDVSLASKGLQGRISPLLGNLTGLLQLNLSHNLLDGSLPMELLFSRSIRVLDVSFNRLDGSLPELQSSSDGFPLQVLNISSNLFTGQFSSKQWEAMKNIVALNASNNTFTGQIPSSICINAPSFAILDLCYNQFSGSISPGLGNCTRLREFKAGFNNFSGALPEELFSATALEHLSLPSNDLQGVLDGSHIVKLVRLTVLNLGSTGLSGNIPDSIGQLSTLEELRLDNNNMSGELPSALDFSINNFTGTIPESIYSCSNLIALRLAYNKFHGQLSSRMGNLKSLSFFSISDNHFTNITNALQILRSCKNLTSLLIGTNFKGEAIPQDETVDGFENLRVLTIDSCGSVGQIPPWISKLKKLEVLDLSNNMLTGGIPFWISDLPVLFYLDISNNSLTGDIPASLMNMPMLQSGKNAAQLDTKFLELPVYWTPSRQYRLLNAFPNALNLGNNSFTGVIPPEIGQLKMLDGFNVSFNRLSGEIPEQICNLTNLQVLDLSNNQLTGELPAALTNMHFLSKFNVSNNELEGPVPTGRQFDTFLNTSYSGNPKLCGTMLIYKCDSVPTHASSMKRGNKKAIIALALGVFFGGIVILFLLGRFLMHIRRTSSVHQNKGSSNGDIEATSLSSVSEHLHRMIKGSILVMVPQGKGESNNLKFKDILKATNNFDQQNIIGCGGNGLVYKAELPNGSMLAIKKLNGEMCLMEREFTAEVDALSMAQHENLVPLWGYCIQGNSRLLIYSYMENGSLDDWLHNRDNGRPLLDWPTRLQIAQGASRGLSYIHNVCKPHIVHRDIKSSNILLDREFRACVADFGLARLILPYDTHVTTELIGTLGYIPPEYSQSWVATLRGDIYSFGVVLLELLTGKRPVQVLSKSKELVQWVREMRSQRKDAEVLDPALRETGYEEQMLKVLDVACKCISYNPCMRPSIQEVVSCLDSVDSADLQLQM
uniref:non-specific serine/threonine protein kinase n=1 Tax=Leersia perrieri TaxID=77586 RepID=A0A0D9WTI3_9ORYZ